MTNSANRPAPDEVEPGIPATNEMPANVPPGWEDAEEPPPLDRPQGAEDWGTTAREELTGESLARRVLREQPDRPGRDGARAAVRVTDPGDDDSGIDDEADLIGDLAEASDSTLSGEEAALRIVGDDPPGATYGDDPGYLDDEDQK